jgi:hypothetical protein
MGRRTMHVIARRIQALMLHLVNDEILGFFPAETIPPGDIPLRRLIS